MIHIIPSGSEKTLCGITGEGTSLGINCNCPECNKKAQEIMNRRK